MTLEHAYSWRDGEEYEGRLDDGIEFRPIWDVGEKNLTSIVITGRSISAHHMRQITKLLFAKADAEQPSAISEEIGEEAIEYLKSTPPKKGRSPNNEFFYSMVALAHIYAANCFETPVTDLAGVLDAPRQRIAEWIHTARVRGWLADTPKGKMRAVFGPRFECLGVAMEMVGVNTQDAISEESVRHLIGDEMARNHRDCDCADE